MTRREKFGKLVLLEDTEATGVGTEHRAAKLGPTGLEKIVTILRLKPAISSHPDLARNVMDQAKAAAQLQNPNVLKIFGIGKVEQWYYISYEHVEGKSLRAILDRCRHESFPFQVEHALLIASKVASALEYAHGRRNDAGARYIHGLLTPAQILVSYEGEVRVKGFGFWPSHITQADVLPPEELRYLAPEQATGGGDSHSDIYALGAVLFETLTAQEPGPNLVGRLGTARLASPTGDDATIPKPLGDILHKSLSSDPAQRYGDMQEMRKAIDTLLFSGDFTPTTFNLAFFMHSLYREEIERETRALKEEKEANYHEFLTDDLKPASGARPPVATTNKTEPVDPRLIAAARAAAEAAAPPIASEPPSPMDTNTVSLSAPVPPAPPVASPAAAHPPHQSSPGLSAKDAASGFTFHKEEVKADRRPLVLGLGGVAVVAAGIGGWLLFRHPGTEVPPTPATTTLSPAAAAALDRVKELEEKLAAMEREKAEAETKAADDAKKKIEAQAAARGQVIDAAAVAKAQEEARKKAAADQERRQQEELKRIADEKKAEEARLAEEKRRADEAAARLAEQQRQEAAKAAEQAAATTTLPPPPTTTAAVAAPEPPATTLSANGVRPGTLVNLTDPGVTPPVAEKAPPPVYPPIALRQRVEGVVELNVFVDEKGTVVETQVVQGAGGRAGLTEAAIDSVKKRRYRPATKDGVPVKVWLPVRVLFQLPR
jgi:TonB family protein